MSEEKRNQWLEERRKYIGGSDVAAILGIDPRRGEYEVWASKVYGYSDEQNDAMLFGQLFERPIGQAYHLKTGRFLCDDDDLRTAIKVHPEIPFLGATLDDLTMGCETNPNPFNDNKPGPLEIKRTNGYVKSDERWKKMLPEDWIETPPLYYQAQLQTQMACVESQWGSLTALIDNSLVWKDFIRNDRFLKTIYPILEDFWRLVVDKIPPKLDDTVEHLETVKRVFPDDNHLTIKLDDEAAQMAQKWEDTKKQIASLDKEKRSLEANLRAVMQDNTFGVLPDGRKLTLKKTFSKGYTRVVEPNEFRVLRIAKK